MEMETTLSLEIRKSNNYSMLQQYLFYAIFFPQQMLPKLCDVVIYTIT